MPWEPDPITVERILWTGTVLGVIIFIVSAVGEWRGWWDLGGEIGMVTGIVATVVLGTSSLIRSADRRQVSQVHSAVVDNGSKLSSMDLKLDKLDKLDDMDEKLDKLDVVHIELDRQTGVLDRQVGILEAIRDRL